MNPYTKYEVCLDKTPAWFAIAAILLAALCICGVIYLSATAPEPVIPSSVFRIPKPPAIPDVKTNIQSKVDQALSGKPEVQ